MFGNRPHNTSSYTRWFILGGTNYDANLGVTHLNQYGIDAIPIGISENPVEQTWLQTNGQKKLLNLLLEKLYNLNGENIIVYCNSLSFAVNWVQLRKLTKCNFYPLTNVYQNIAIKYTSVSLVSGNNCMLSNASAYITSLNNNISILGFSYLPIICKIENNDCTVRNILKSTIDISISSGVGAVIMGCTHFENIVFESNSKIDIIYPAKRNRSQGMNFSRAT